MDKIIRFFTTTSILVFLAVILLVYAFVPDPCGVVFNKQGEKVYEVSRNLFFYTSLILFIIIQAVFIISDQSILSRYTSGRWKSFRTWFFGLRLSINLFLIVLLIFTGLANNAVDFSFSSIQFLAYLAPAFLFIWLISLPFFLLKRRII